MRAHRRERGSATAELAAALPVLVLLLAVAVTAVAAVTAQLRCVDAAREAARAAARGTPDAMEAGERAAPAGARITVDTGSETVRVTVRARISPFADWLPAPEVTATAVAETEPGVPGVTP
jgi:Flp pilus assembly protein TadG